MSINVLPQKEKDDLAKGGKLRIVIISLRASFVIFVLGSLFLVPTYIITDYKLEAINKRKEVSFQSGEEEKDLLNAPKMINHKADLAIRTANSDLISTKIIPLSLSENAGITIRKISFDNGQNKPNEPQPKKIIVWGIADTRDSLRAYERKVSEFEFVENTSIPVGDFAKDLDLFFTLTVDLK